MLTFKVTTVGGSEGFILNKEAKLRLNVKKATRSTSPKRQMAHFASHLMTPSSHVRWPWRKASCMMTVRSSGSWRNEVVAMDQAGAGVCSA